MHNILKDTEVKVTYWKSFRKSFVDREGNKYIWHTRNDRGNHSSRCLRIGRFIDNHKTDFNLIIKASYCERAYDILENETLDKNSINVFDIGYVKLRYTDNFIKENLIELMAPLNTDGVRVFDYSFITMLRNFKFPEELIPEMLELLEKEKLTRYKDYAKLHVSGCQKLSEDFIMNNLDILDVKHLKIRHLGARARNRIKMLRELIT